MVEPGIRESLVPEPLDWIGEDTDPRIIVEVAQVGILVEQHAWCVVIETCSGNPPSGHLFGVIRRMEVVDVDVLGKRDETVVRENVRTVPLAFP